MNWLGQKIKWKIRWQAVVFDRHATVAKHAGLARCAYSLRHAFSALIKYCHLLLPESLFRIFRVGFEKRYSYLHIRGNKFWLIWRIEGRGHKNFSSHSIWRATFWATRRSLLANRGGFPVPALKLLQSVTKARLHVSLKFFVTFRGAPGICSISRRILWHIVKMEVEQSSRDLLWSRRARVLPYMCPGNYCKSTPISHQIIFRHGVPLSVTDKLAINIFWIDKTQKSRWYFWNIWDSLFAINTNIGLLKQQMWRSSSHLISCAV